MVKYSYYFTPQLLVTLLAPGCAFTSTGRNVGQRRNEYATLHAVSPTFIISPIIKKFREEQAKKNAPLATDDEKSAEAPGLRIGKDAWKWPPVWPFADDLFVPQKEEAATPAPNPMATVMQQQMGGTDALPPTPEKVEVEKLDMKKYWQEEMVNESTNLDPLAAAKLTEHYSFYIKDDMSVLELGAAEDSYLPENVQLSRHTGVSLSGAAMDQNPKLTEKLIVDLNDVKEEEGVNSPELYGLGSEQFDVVIMANTFDFLTSPREVYKSAWRLLKPDGVMMVSFSGPDAYNQFEAAQTKWWRTFNSDQHMWVAGSFFQFSAGGGWTGLKGFDISPEGAKSVTGGDSILDNLTKKDRPKNMFVVQATKVAIDEAIDDSDPEKSFSSKMWLIPTLESRDKELVAARLSRVYVTSSAERRRAISSHIDLLPKIYESLIKMDQFAFPFGLQAQLAVNVVSDPDYNGNDEQITALRMGLGLKKPSEDFWAPVGKLTAKMDAEDKVNLLTYIVPRFGSGNPAQDEALEAFVSGMTPTFEVLRTKCPDFSEADVQLLGTELLAAEVLIPGRSTREEYASWLGSLTSSELEEVLAKRKAFKADANAAMVKFQEERQAEEDRKLAELEAYKEQLKKASEERTMVFDEETGKMVEVVEKK
mmetsp:Transcript_29712/g.43595  ORF Transcript_29712/g.43595 Transcript_29712/m.43595 type:complete len:649 (-) Transcript_29712:29-1975(-)